MTEHALERRYRALSYPVLDGADWFPAVYGHVPGYQIDYIYRPSTPANERRALRPAHMRHLTALIRYLEAAAGVEAAFLLGNLSTMDHQHRPGHGGLALVCSLRVEGANDQAGRQRPVLTHCMMIVDRAIASAPLAQVLTAFMARVLAEGPRWYIRFSQASPDTALDTLERYLGHFAGLPAPVTLTPPEPWRKRGARPFQQLHITCPRITFSAEMAICAARLAAVLYHSDVAWTSISNGYQADEDASSELWVRFVQQRSAFHDPPGVCTRPLAEIAAMDEPALAALLGLSRLTPLRRLSAAPVLRPQPAPATVAWASYASPLAVLSASKKDAQILPQISADLPTRLIMLEAPAAPASRDDDATRVFSPGELAPLAPRRHRGWWLLPAPFVIGAAVVVGRIAGPPSRSGGLATVEQAVEVQRPAPAVALPPGQERPAPRSTGARGSASEKPPAPAPGPPPHQHPPARSGNDRGKGRPERSLVPKSDRRSGSATRAEVMKTLARLQDEADRQLSSAQTDESKQRAGALLRACEDFKKNVDVCKDDDCIRGQVDVFKDKDPAIKNALRHVLEDTPDGHQ